MKNNNKISKGLKLRDGATNLPRVHEQLEDEDDDEVLLLLHYCTVIIVKAMQVVLASQNTVGF